ncbi:MAG: efflux RND transporter periplasmic adaptor subunit [Pseudomonadota bacterium]
MTRCTAAVVFAALLAAGCSRDKPPPADADKRLANAEASGSPHTDEPEHEAFPKRVRLDPKVIADARVRSAPVVGEPLAATIDLPGEIASNPDKTASVAAPVAGRIASVNFKEGQFVKKGDLLAVVTVPELGKVKAAYSATTSKAIAARTNADRLQALAEKRLAADQEVVSAKAEADAFEAEARAASDQLNALGSGSAAAGGSLLSLRAPVSGVVVSRNAIVGQPVAPDATLATITDLSQVWFLARVFEKNLSVVRVGAPVEVTLNAYPKERFQGSVEYLGKQIDPTARTLVARIALTNRADLLRLGMFGTARVGTGEESDHKSVLVVPRDAVTEIGGKTVVFVQQPDGDYDVHEVVLGEEALGKVRVVSGLREHELVVVDGVFTLKSAVMKSSFGEAE